MVQYTLFPGVTIKLYTEAAAGRRERHKIYQDLQSVIDLKQLSRDFHCVIA